MSMYFKLTLLVTLTTTLWSVFPAINPGVAAAQNYSLFGMGQSGVLRPQVYAYYNPWTWSPLFGPPTIGSGFPQPLGFQHISTGPNSYVF